ncbi:5-oxoprolinase subunit B family protein [Intrasporangium chromatireducens]|uniref:5-oxoprolinase subunit B family protein n=1 Tax=Intrasporangium chromatireducens TaxID=1386088 RepID=UPI0004B4740C|nr:allophanate hydrolase subunit 1 [Intrasporangium chromatireducens]
MSAAVAPALRILPMGDAALLVETGDLATVLALERHLTRLVRRGEGPWATVDDLVPAARTLLLVARPDTDLAGLAAAVTAAGRNLAEGDSAEDAGSPPDADSPHVEIAVRYDGPDLDDVARLTGLAPNEVVAAHTGTPWRVAFGGFSPGFAYLVGGDPRLMVPRRAEPRPRVPAGAVGLAGEFSGIYPRESPGGWQLIGRTDAPLWDPDRDPPALLSPGALVRFVAAAGC